MIEDFSIDGLNREQRIPVEDTDGAILVVAGAGSGKTRMLTHRIAYLVCKKSVSPYNILAITFTNKAATEMKSRLAQMLPDTHGLWVSTFHSMCVSILRMFIEEIGFGSNFSIYSEAEKERVVKRLLKEQNVEDQDNLSKRILSAISWAKNEGYSPDEYNIVNKYMKDIDLICAVYAGYEKELKKSNSLDFDDLLLYTHRLLKDSQRAREYCQNRFKYIHVDEFQDTNTIQYKLLIQLAAKYRNIFAVGDEDQSIYGWRGANIQNMRSFIKDFGAKIYKLEQNYRSTQQILSAANALISNNSMRIEKNLWTENEEGLQIEHYAGEKDSYEADYVIRTISSLRGKGYRLSDMAILMRVNALSRGFEQRFLQYGVAYRVFGGFKFFERKEVKDILAYCRMIANPADNDAITRIINFPKRGIGEAAVKQIAAYASVSGISLFDCIASIAKNPDLPISIINKIKPFSQVVNTLLQKKDSLRPHQFLSFVVDLIGLRALYAEPTEENENRLMHIAELIESAAEFSNQNPEADINDYLQMVTLYTDTDEMDQSKDYVSIATIHSAKGLEFPVVFIVGLEEGLFPLSRALEDESELQEERRLMYVAITRAEKRLYLTRCKNRFLYGAIKATLPSRFLQEAGIETNEAPSRNERYSDRYSDDRSYKNSDGNAYGRYNGSYGRDNANQGRYNNGYDGGDYKYKDNASNGSGSFYGGGSSAGRGSLAFGVAGAGSQKRNALANEPAKKPANSAAKAYEAGMKVRHKRFGVGTILSIEKTNNSTAEIEFASGKMTLVLDYAPLEIIN